jgi:hypothetical protein
VQPDSWVTAGDEGAFRQVTELALEGPGRARLGAGGGSRLAGSTELARDGRLEAVAVGSGEVAAVRLVAEVEDFRLMVEDRLPSDK